MKFDLFNELLETAIDEEEAYAEVTKANGMYAVSHMVDMGIVFPARVALRGVADDSTVDRCLRKLREERKLLLGKEDAG